MIDFLERRLTRWRFVPQRLAQLVLRILNQLSQALRVLVNARELAETIGWTALLWFGVALANFLVMRAFGLQVGVPETLFVLGWSLVGSLVPTPGGAAGISCGNGCGLLIPRRGKGTRRGSLDRVYLVGLVQQFCSASFMRSGVI